MLTCNLKVVLGNKIWSGIVGINLFIEHWYEGRHNISLNLNPSQVCINFQVDIIIPSIYKSKKKN